MSSDILIQAVILVVSNAATAWFTNSATKKKHSAEAANYISDAYKTLVEDLQEQITIMKGEIDELKSKLSAMAVREVDLSLKVKNLETENLVLKRKK
jgi:pyrroloquinoline quinone (PQQ) biosynthesis protein C